MHFNGEDCKSKHDYSKCVDSFTFTHALKCSYKQVKFNLLREENEGYSKLVVDLSEHCDTDDTNEKALHTIRCLIGACARPYVPEYALHRSIQSRSESRD